MFENIREAFDGIWSHKLRSALTMLGVIIGIASIIAISSTIMGTNEQIKQNLVGAGNNTVEVALYQGDYALDPSYQQVPEYVTPLDASILPELLKIKQVEDASLFYRRDAYGMIWYGSEGLNQGSVYGVDEHFLSVNGYVIRSGRGFLPEDFAGYKKVALIDRTVSETLFMGKNPVNKTIEIMSEPYVVVGEFTQNSAFTPTITSINDYFTYTDHSGGKVLIPASTWPTLFSYDQPSSVVVRAGSTDDMTEAGKQTAALLNKTLTGSGDVTYKSKDLLEQAKKLQELSSATNRQLIWIASISLLVGGIGVMNIMLVSVAERVSEIGLRKAVGAKKRRILGQFLTEAAVLTFTGGVLGVAAGVGVSKALSKISGTPSAISLPAIGIAVVFSMLVGVIFGLLPAMKAANMSPIEALKRE